jgi:hypothetical protein
MGGKLQELKSVMKKVLNSESKRGDGSKSDHVHDITNENVFKLRTLGNVVGEIN